LYIILPFIKPLPIAPGPINITLIPKGSISYTIDSLKPWFDRSTYSINFKRNNGRRKWRWYEELKEQRVRDIQTEMLQWEKFINMKSI
jgi:hypothetical protein